VLFAIVWIIVGGLIIGALGRLAIPGPNPMSIGMTILVGIGGSIIGGLLGAIFGRGFVLVLSIAGAALLVWLIQRNQHGRTTAP
jgi:uncharacterized membrane protein YeaQ/YmgE (transglycosylase-associated protein family)